MKGNPWRNITLIDLVLLALVIIAVVFFFFRMKTVLGYHWQWEAMPGYFLYKDPTTGQWVPNVLLKGFFTTIKLSVWATGLGLFLGILSGMMGAGGDGFQRFVSRIYVEGIRNIPSLVLLFIFYYFISSQFLDLLGMDQWLRQQPEGRQQIISVLFASPARINAFISAVIALGLYEGAYISEIVRGGINGIPTGQWEAASAIGLSRSGTFGLVILPQAFRATAFPMAGQFISCIKDSAIVSVVSIQELTFQGMELTAATFLTFEIWIVVTLLYFVLTFSLSQTVGFFEKRSARRRSV